MRVNYDNIAFGQSCWAVEFLLIAFNLCELKRLKQGDYFRTATKFKTSA